MRWVWPSTDRPRLVGAVAVMVLAVVVGGCDGSSGDTTSVPTAMTALEVQTPAMAPITRDGIHVMMPANWDDMTFPSPLFDVPGAWYSAVQSPNGVGNWISIDFGPGVVPAALGTTEEELVDFVLQFVTSGGGVVASGPDLITTSGNEAYRASLANVIGESTGQTLSGEVVLFVRDAGFVALFAQYQDSQSDHMLSVFDEVLETLRFASAPDAP